MAKTDIAWLIMSYANVVDPLYYIRQMAARVTKMVLAGAFGTQFWGRGGRRGSAVVPFKRAMVVPYTLSIVTTALSLTIRPQFAIECLRRSDQQRVGHFRSKFWGFSLWDVMLGT